MTADQFQVLLYCLGFGFGSLFWLVFGVVLFRLFR